MEKEWPKYYVSPVCIVDLWSEKHKSIIKILNEQGYGLSASGPLIGLSWEGSANYFFNKTAVYHCHAKFTVCGSSKEDVKETLSLLGLPTENISEKGPKNPF